MAKDRSFESLYNWCKKFHDSRFFLDSGQRKIILTPDTSDINNIVPVPLIEKGLKDGMSFSSIEDSFVETLIVPTLKKNTKRLGQKHSLQSSAQSCHIGVTYVEDLEYGEQIEILLGRFVALQTLVFFIPEKISRLTQKTNRVMVKNFFESWQKTYQDLSIEEGKDDAFIAKIIGLSLSKNADNLTFEEIKHLVEFGVSTDKILAGLQHDVGVEMIEACSPLPFTEIGVLFAGLQEDTELLLPDNSSYDKLSMKKLLENNLKRKRK